MSFIASGVRAGGMISDYQGLYQNAYRHLLPGGWFEVRENDLQFFTDTPSLEGEEKLVSLRWWEKLMAEEAKFGKPIDLAARQKEFREQSRLGEWMEGDKWTKVESMYYLHIKHGLEGYTLRLFTKALGWSFEDTMALILQVQAEIANPALKQLQLYSYFRLIAGKKPDDACRKP
ncbi:hypothetical protein BDV10DRAFT_189190 [Aspergillus recurvatus]